MFGPAAFATAAGIFAVHVGGRATREALFLSIFGYKAQPAMMMVTAVFAVVFAFLWARVMVRWGPGRVMPAAFATSAGLLLLDWGVSAFSLPATAILLYLQSGALGALLISGFWSTLSERLDPRSAKMNLGRLAAVGTAGGLLGGLLADQVGRILPVTTMFPMLAAIHLLCAGTMMRVGGVNLADGVGGPRSGPAASKSPDSGMTREARAGMRALAATPYIQNLLLLLVLVTIAEALVDLALKGRVTSATSQGGSLLRFFAVFYTGTQVLVFFVQAFLSRRVLERLGPARTAAVLPAGAAVAAAGALAAPGLSSAITARVTQSVLMPSLFNAGYEVLFTPVPARDKRTIKSLVDVGGSRAGDLLGAALAQGVVLLAVPVPPVLLGLAIGISVIAFYVAHRMQRGYVEALARGLVSRAVHLELSDATDSITRSTLMRTLETQRVSRGGPGAPERDGASREGALEPQPEHESPEALRARALSSRDPATVRDALGAGPLPPPLYPAVVSLLAWDPVAREAIEALRRAGSASIDALVEPLLDGDGEFTIRRRVPLVLGTIAHPRAVQALLVSILDRRFEVRYRSGRALAHLLTLDPALAVPPDAAFAAVLHEVQTAAGVWERRSLLDRMDDEAWSPVMDELVKNRADQSLEHVFTLLALVLPRKPLRIAFRGLHTDDPLLRGTALEYLESVLPPDIKKPLWPYLEPERARRPAGRPGESLDALLRMNDSIAIKLEDLRRKE